MSNTTPLKKKIQKEWDKGAGLSCPEHPGLRSMWAGRTWEEPCARCLIKARRSVFPREHGNNEHAPDVRDINLYIKFLTFPSPRLDYLFMAMQAVREERKISGPLTIESDLYRTVELALRRKGEKASLWEREHEGFGNSRELIGYRLDMLGDWFLRRYHLSGAWQMLRVAQRSSRRALGPALRKGWGLFGTLVVLLALTGLAAWWCLWARGFHHMAFSCDAGVVVALGVVWQQLGWHNLLRLLLPRQLGAIIVGYFLLMIIGAEFWDVLRSILADWSWCAVWIPLGLCGLIVAYLNWEVKSELGYALRQKDSLRRAFSVALLGLMESVAVGVVFFNLVGHHLGSLFSEPFLPTCQGTALSLEQTIFVFTYMTLALFVGIFVQIFWQEKPITVAL